MVSSYPAHSKGAIILRVSHILTNCNQGLARVLDLVHHNLRTSERFRQRGAIARAFMHILRGMRTGGDGDASMALPPAGLEGAVARELPV